MQEHEYYNLYASGSRYSHEAQQQAMAFTLQLLVNHLYQDHNMTVRQIAKRFKRKEKEVKALLYEEVLATHK